jgi:hypothetical protein
MGNIDTQWKASSFDNFVTNLPYIFLNRLDELKPDMVRSLFKQRAWNPAQGDRVSFDSYALPQYASRSNGENSEADLLSIAEGDTMTVTQQEYSGKFNYTHRMDTFDKERVASMFASRVVDGINNVIDLEMTHKVLTYAEAATYTPRNKSTAVDWVGADGKALAATNHSVTSGATFSTEYTTAGSLSTTTLTQMEQTARETHVNELGEAIDIDMDTIIIPKNNFMIKKAFEIFGTPNEPSTNLNTMNIFKTQWGKKIVVLNKGQLSRDGKTYLTTDTASYRYAMVDSRYLENWQYQMSNAPTIALKDTDIDTVLKVVMGIAYCAFATVRAQGYMIHRQNVTKPQVTD